MLREKSCGIVPYRVEDGNVLYLVISSALTRREHWEFPKGGVEEGEREIDTALRELEEETGVKDVELIRGFRQPIRYIYRRREGLISKQVVYFLALVNDPTVTLREVEAKDFRWANYDEARRLLRHINARSLLAHCHERITGHVPPAPQPDPLAAAVPEVLPPGEGQRRRKRRRKKPKGTPASGTPPTSGEGGGDPVI